MNEPLDDELGPLLRDYLSSQLDGQLGKAPTRFAQGDTAEPTPARLRTPRGGRLLASAAAIAAALALAIWCGLRFGWLGSPAQRHEQNSATASKPDVSPQPPNERSHLPAPQAEHDPSRQDVDERPANPPVANERMLVGQQLQWRTIDEGIVYLDPYTPVRKLRRQRLERVEWYDAARGARVQMIVPREEVQFVALPSS